MSSAISGHITKLKQYILLRCLWFIQEKLDEMMKLIFLLSITLFYR